MIPREILKKIRQIDLRTNRLVRSLSLTPGFSPVTGDGEGFNRFSGFPRAWKPFKRLKIVRDFLTGLKPGVNERVESPSLQPSAQFGRISFPVPDRADYHFGRFRLDGEINRVRPRLRHPGSSGQTTGGRKAFGILANHSEKSPQLLGKSLAYSRLASVVESNRLRKFPFRLLFNDDPKRHCLARNLFSMSATTSSSGRQSSGCVKARSARRSSSATCIGVSSSSKYSLRTFSATSYCSASGKRWICSKICVALMAAIYPAGLFAQARFSAHANSSFAIRHSSFA